MDRFGQPIGQGSGFIVTDDGIIITNFHVMEDAYSAQINFSGVIFEGVRLIAGLPEFDLALVKIDALGLPGLSFGDSDVVKDGESIVAIGNPLGLERTVSNGIISAVRVLENITMLQITAPVSLGSSGGPILNEYGQVIGVTTLATSWGAQNVNFAVPIKYIQSVIARVRQ
jgi:S1-C subfamily serine protease